MSQARHIIEREGPYWAVRDTYVRGVVMAYDRSEDVARARAALLDAGGSLEHLPHCPRCGEMVPADGDGMVMSHSIPDDTPANRPAHRPTHDLPLQPSPDRKEYPMASKQDIIQQVKATLGDHPETFDVDAIVEQLREEFPEAQSIYDIDSEDYREIVRSHDTKAKQEAADELLTEDVLMFINRALHYQRDGYAAHVETLRERDDEHSRAAVTDYEGRMKRAKEIQDLIGVYMNGPQE